MTAILAALIMLCALGGSVLFMARICSDTTLEGGAYRAQWSERACRIGKWMMLAAVGGLVALALSGCGTGWPEDPVPVMHLERGFDFPALGVLWF